MSVGAYATTKEFDFLFKFSRTFKSRALMYSTASPSFSTSCKIDSLMVSPKPCRPLASVPPPPDPRQHTSYPAAMNPISPSRLVSCNPTIRQPFRQQTSTISSAWPRLFLLLKARVRTLKVPTINSPTRVFNLAALRIDRLTRCVFRSFLLFSPAALNHLAFLHGLVWCSPCFQPLGCSTPDPPHLSTPCLLVCLLTWDLLAYLLSILRSPCFPRRSPIVDAGQTAAGNLLHEYWGAIPSARPRQRTTIRRSTQKRGHCPTHTTYRYQARGTRHRYPPTNPWAEGLYK